MKPKGWFTCIFSLAVTSSYLLLIHFPIATANGYINPKCAGGTYNTSSTFQTNLNALFTSLTSLSSTSNAANTTAGRAGDSNIVYGLYLCQGDLASSDCKSCVQTATTDVVQTCPDSRQATIWYDNCILRYSNLDFFGVPDSTGFNMTNPDQATSSPVPFEMVSDLVRVAPLQPRMFASNASVFAGLYGMAQCTSDLNSTGCSRCLNTILGYINTCCTKRNGWRYLAASCWVRYEATPFLKNLNNTYTEVIQYNCSGAADGARSRSSLDSVLNNATSRAQPTGFSTAVAAGSLYALALCRADLAAPGDVCSDCLDSAHSKFTDSCQNQTQGIMWFEKCMLRYSDQNFFGSVDYRGRTLCNTGKVTKQADDDTIALASKLVVDAVNIPLMSAAGEVKTGSSNTTVGYVLVQCTRDLTSSACTSCLQTGIDSLANACKQINGWRYLSGSCTIRFETFAFYDTSALALETSPAATGGSPPTDDNLPSPPTSTDGGGKSTPVAAIVGPIAGALLVVSMIAGLYLSRRRLENWGSRRHQLAELSEYLPYMDLATVQRATDNFSKENELGRGGFGSVYKGTQAGGREIAVKRLSAKSKQGDVEFKNEVKLIAKLQHRNLVKVLGYCDEREEKLLIYEYLPNKSLDFFLTDPTKRSMLDWQKRVIIVAGVARGLLYLHEDSTLKVIHRDLKASNVLLDKDMNAKISDFGMAKIYEADQSEANTNRVVGTFGYMAPEYAMDGIFSVKSDVYSFGVLLLEIISGKRNGRSHFEQHGQTLVRYAWQLWCDGNATQLMDELLTDTYTAEEATKYIHIGLLCVQDDAEARPTMSSVILMLRSEQMVLPQPTQPPTFIRRAASISDNSSSTATNSTPAMSINQVTNTDLIPR